ncbi:putative peptidase YuxL [Reticulibacter mediterranei]|uniref:Putative peptidase YuxL n=1 Tax=Reticulibacter mediterranei TaxID=2778369 RepID=A0A8J3IQK9_9CHLR|nr:S9 family peptidase [Reticulibacter mediterranei]GHO96124.1 putative peptidase YuxL [Reticulibacter mediterranei]
MEDHKDMPTPHSIIPAENNQASATPPASQDLPAQETDNADTTDNAPTGSTNNTTTDSIDEQTEVHPPAIPEQEAALEAPVEDSASPASEAATTIEQPAIEDKPETAVPAQPASENKTIVAHPSPSALPYMSIEDLLALQIAGDPQISPDGSLIAFTVLQCHAEENITSSAIWLVNSAGGKNASPWQITGGEYHDSQPRWSPDGRTLAFVSDRTGTAQIFLLSLRGGEARQLSSLTQGVSAYSWRPDGAMLLAHSLWKPGDDQSDSQPNNAANIYTRIDAHWDGDGYKYARHQQLWLLPLEGEAIRLTSEPVDLLQSCWSPDGQEIVFAANRRPDPDLSVSMALWVLTVATGQLRRLTPEDGLAQMPSWSPDGQKIAYLYTADQTETSNIAPWIVSPGGGGIGHPAVTGAEQLTCQAWIIDELREEYLARPQWYPDSKALLVPVQERGQLHLHRLDLEQNTRTQITSGNGRYISAQISNNGQSVALVRADWFTPGDIWGMDSNGQNLRKLTKVNDTLLRGRQVVRPKRITWQGADGLEIEGFLYLPPLAENTRAPLIVTPHGGPSLAWGDAYIHEFQVLAGRGYAVLAPNIRGSAGYGEEFCRRILNDWGGKDFHDLMAGVAHVIAHEAIDEKRVGIGGISYGGYMTNWAITQTSFFKAAVSRNGISSIVTAGLLSDQTIWFHLSMDNETLQQQRSPLTFVDTITTPLLLLHGESDLRCPTSESMQLFVALRKRKRTVELVSYPSASHLMDWPQVGQPQQRVDRLRRSLEWFEHFV